MPLNIISYDRNRYVLNAADHINLSLTIVILLRPNVTYHLKPTDCTLSSLQW